MSPARRHQVLFGPRQSGRRGLTAPVKLIVGVSALLIGMVGMAAVASAHHAEVTATSSCQSGTAQVAYTAIAWNGSSTVERTNDQVEIAYSTNGRNAPWTVVTVGHFTQGNKFTFSGTFSPIPGTPGTTVTVRAVALVNWADGAEPGAAQYADAILKGGCTPLSVALPCPSNVSYGTATTFTAAATGGAAPYRYRWSLGGQPLTSTSSTATVVALSSNDIVSVTVTDDNGATATARATDCPHGTYPKPTVSVECPAGGFVFGQPATWKADGKPAVATDSLSYQWLLNATPIQGADHASYAATLSSSKDVLSVTVTETFADSHTTSSPAGLAPEDCRGSYPKPVASIACPAGGFVFGQPATWTADAKAEVPGDSLSYQWLQNGKSVGASSKSLTTTLASASDTLSVTVTETFVDTQSTTSAPVTAQCQPNIPNPVVAITCPTSFVYGQPSTWTAVATPGGSGDTLSYQWYLNGKPIAGAVQAAVTATLASSDDVLSVTVTEVDQSHTSRTASTSATCQGSYPKPVVTILCPVSFTFGQPAVWTAAATPGIPGDKLSYRWTVNGSLVGVDSPSVTTTLDSAADTLSVTVTETFADAKTASASALSGCVDAPPVPVVVTDVDSSPSSPSAAAPTSANTATLPFTGSNTLALFAVAMGLIGVGVIVLRLNGSLKGGGSRQG